jgi:hypothetical protein
MWNDLVFCPEKVKYRTHVTPLTERNGTVPSVAYMYTQVCVA